MQWIKTFLILLFLIILTACNQSKVAEVKPSVVLVKAMTITNDMGKLTRNYPARVNASQEVNMSFLVSGRLISFPVHEGQQVTKGTLLAKLDPTDYEIKVSQQKAKYDYAEITYERFKILLPTNAISKSQYDEKKSIYELEKANLDEAKKALADTEICAPFDGVIANKYVENHQFVEAKQNIVSIQNVTDIELILYIPEQDITNADELRKLKNAAGNNQVGYAEFTSIPNAKFLVTVKEVQTEADPNTQSYKVTLLLKRPEQKLILPGMTATVYLQYQAKTEGIKIPFSAVFIGADKKNYVWVVDQKSSTVKMQAITISQLKTDTVEVTDGLKIGDTIVTAGVSYLQSGMKVKIQNGRIGY